MSIVTRLLNKNIISGFSLAEIMVGMGILSAAALLVARLQETSSSSMKRVKNKSIETEFKTRVADLLSDEQGCLKTLKQAGGISENQELTQFIDRNGNSVFTKDAPIDTSDTAQKSQIILKKILVATLTTDANGYGDLRLLATVERPTDIKTKKATEITYPFDLKVTITGGVATSCHSAVKNAIDTSVEASCRSLGGEGIDSDNQKCNMANYAATTSDSIAVSTEYLSNFYDDSSIPDIYVLKAGDTMSGQLKIQNQLDVSGEVKSDTLLCAQGNCRNFSSYTCPTNQVMTGINSDGSIQCRAISCPNQQHFIGFDATGNSVCAPFNQGTCLNDQYVQSISQGNVTCAPLPPSASTSCPVNYYMQSIINGVAVCVKNVVPALCPAGSVMTGFNANKQVTCAQLSTTLAPKLRNVFRGADGSLHDNNTPIIAYTALMSCGYYWSKYRYKANYIPCPDGYTPIGTQFKVIGSWSALGMMLGVYTYGNVYTASGAKTLDLLKTYFPGKRIIDYRYTNHVGLYLENSTFQIYSYRDAENGKKSNIKDNQLYGGWCQYLEIGLQTCQMNLYYYGKIVK